MITMLLTVTYLCVVAAKAIKVKADGISPDKLRHTSLMCDADQAYL